TQLTAAVSELLAASPDLDVLLDRAASLMVPELADSAALYLLPRTDVARRLAIANVDAALADELLAADRRWPLDIPRLLASGGELRGGTPVMVTNVTDEMRVAFSQHPDQLDLSRRLGVQSSITAPLHVGDDIVGLLFLDYTAQSGRMHQPDDIGLVEELAERLVLVLERAYLTAEAERANARLDLLAEVSELLTVGLDTRARLDAVTDVVLPTFADACVAFLAGPDGLAVTAGKVVAGSAPREAETTELASWGEIPPVLFDSTGPVALAFRSREPVLVSEVPHDLAGLLDPVDDAAEPMLDLRSALVVPLLADEEPLGVLLFGYCDTGRLYAVEDLALAREIARRVAPAVEDAMRFEREFATAEALQRSLLPEGLPVLQNADVAARYVPGGVGLKVGGDWYDAVPLRDGRVMLVIGDVVGHGVRAAASMGKLRNVLQYSALDGLTPAAVLQRLNAYFCSLPDADMATLFIAEYDPQSRRIRYANAGHPPACLRLPDGAIEMLEDGRSMPLCASDQSRYRDAEHDLPAGSLLVLYTDGLVERRGESLDVGLERLAETLRQAPTEVEDVADVLLRELLDDAAPQDDVAVLCIGTVPAAENLHLRLPAAPRQLAYMRSALSAWLATIGASQEDAREITVAVNEVVANAVEHAYGLVDADFELEARQVGALVELEIRDFGRWRNRRDSGDRGRGLDLARALMHSIDVQPGVDGTVVVLRRQLERGQDEA
ncbi:MAG: SpoIIE family protein phosphatase, partial [Microbacterium sp.]